MKHGVILLINTSQTNEIAVGIRHKPRDFWLKENITAFRAQRVLPLLLTLLESKKYTWEDVAGIEIDPGPGSYTGLRVGFAVANALGLLLGVPVNGVVGKSALPRYSDKE